MNEFTSRVLARSAHANARVLSLATPHGEVQTPCFMPVGTHAAVVGLTPSELLGANTQMILGGNTYHMLLAPGLDVIRQAGGMHEFMAWDGPMLIDSGGFQVFSLTRKSGGPMPDEDGVTITDPRTGALTRLTPEISIGAQKALGADIVMAFDYCTPDAVEHHLAREYMQLSHRWLARSLACHRQQPASLYGARQAFFGIVQGGRYEELRRESLQHIVSQGVDGVAFGGETIGFEMPRSVELIGNLAPLAPESLPRYTMGLGAKPRDLIEIVRVGADMFDCVSPTRIARHGSVYSGTFVASGDWMSFDSEFPDGILNLNNARFRADEQPIMPDCCCATCQSCSRGYLRYLMKERSLEYFAAASLHNIHVMNETCARLRKLILDSL